jgi:hypothetical protein
MARQRRKINICDPVVVCICAQGDLPASWCEYFGTQSMTVSVDKSGSPATTLVKPVDQSTILGIINHLKALGLPLISVECLPEES